MNPKWEDDWTSDVNYEAMCNVIEDSVDHGVVLDLGCGYGRWLCSLAKHYKLVVGIDIQKDFLQWVRNYQVFLPSNVHLVQAAVARLPIHSATANAILAWALLCDIPPDAIPSLFGEMSRVLKEGGRLWIVLHPFSWVAKDLIRSLLRLRFKSVASRCIVIANSLAAYCGVELSFLFGRRSIESFQTGRNMRRRLRRCGFEDVQIDHGRFLVVSARKCVDVSSIEQQQSSRLAPPRRHPESAPGRS